MPDEREDSEFPEMEDQPEEITDEELFGEEALEMEGDPGVRFEEGLEGEPGEDLGLDTGLDIPHEGDLGVEFEGALEGTLDPDGMDEESEEKIPVYDELEEQTDLEPIDQPQAEEFHEEAPVAGWITRQDMKDALQVVQRSLREVPLQATPSVKQAFEALPVVVSPESGGTLFLPEDDPIRQPLISEPLDPRLVYTRPVPRRLRHLTCERRAQEYHKPSGLYRPGT